MKLIIGAHMSISRGIINSLKEIEKINGNAIQIFTGSPMSLEKGKILDLDEKSIDEIKKFNSNNIPIFIHSKYLLNFSRDLIPKSKIYLVRYVQDLDFSQKIDGSGVVLHFGSAVNGIDKKLAKKNMVESLISCLDHANKKSIPILETSSGEGNYIGKTIDDMNDIYKSLPKKYQKRVKFCIDTCHIFVSGYPIHIPGGFTYYIKQLQKKIGKNKIAVLHLNDSKTKFNEKNDRHEEIGKGYIFNKKLGGNPEVLYEIVNWAYKNEVPMILETHKNFKEQIKYIRKIVVKTGGKINRNGIIEQFSQLMNIHKALGNIHQFQAYKNIVNKLTNIDENISINELSKIDGIGKGIISKIEEFESTGKIKVLQDMKKDKNLMAMYNLQKVYGIGPAIAKKLINDNIFTISELKKALKDKKVSLTRNQKLGLKYYKDLNTVISKEKALIIFNYLKNIFLKYELYLMGGFRLGKKEGKDIDIIFSKNKINDDNIDNILKELNIRSLLIDILEKGKNTVIILLKIPEYKYVVHIDIKITEKKFLPFFTLYFGSGENFSRKIRSHAKSMGFKLNEYGLTNIKTGKVILLKSEKEIFKYLKMDYIKPENRL